MIHGQKKLNSTKEEFIKTIDLLFLKLELAYHYQFYKVFGTDERLSEGKKIWATSLKNIDNEVIIKAVEDVISSQSFLPTLTDISKACEDIINNDGFPSPEEAYLEARKSYQPRKNFNWSHPIVYFAGRKTGWNLLNEKDTKENFYVFRKEYLKLKNKFINEKSFEIDLSDDKDETRKSFSKSLFEKLRKKYKI